ncbi:MAG: HAMP domain-containing histidine kinase [Bdellovibrionaceae bacterium]|nr:HAMP domain-containing histidine kinase [Bdellovibrionales bacterium]MCB9082748.1 HAMP domain-containing histidine kinase [Pseudobdellovibrionaceae bacterium]
MKKSGRKQDSIEAQLLLQDRLASVGLLAAGLAHEMGTPLGTIRGRAEMLLARHDQGEDGDSLRAILGQVDRVAALLQTLVRFCASADPSEFTSVSVRRATEEVIELVRSECESHDIKVTCVVPDEAQVFGTLAHLEQILVNLLVNAIQAMEECGDTVSKEIRISAEKYEDEWVLRVTDSGPGIPAHIQTEIFRAFYTTKEIGRGSGLGLTISAKLVDELGGRIHLSESGSDGTTFDLYFPVYKNKS